MTPLVHVRMTTKFSRIEGLISLSSRLDDLIEFGAGAMGEEAIQAIFGKGGGWSKYARGGVSRAAVNPGIQKPLLSSASMATGGIHGQSLLDKIRAARTGVASGVSAPVEAGGRGIGSATGAPPPVIPRAAPPAPQGPFMGMSGAPQSPGPMYASTSAPTSAGAAQQVANQAGQNVAAGQAAVQQGKKMGLAGRAGATGAGLLVGGAMVTPDWMLRQNSQAMSAWIDDIIQFADPRPRNPLGEFTGQEGGPDANAMATVYKMPQPNEGAGLPKLAGAALVGGALGQVGGNLGKEGWTGMAKLVKHLSKKTKVK